MPTPTGYTVNTGTAATPSYTDLADIFKSLASSTKAQITGFQDSTGNDLNQLFDPLLTGQSGTTTKTYLISASTGGDLNTVFAPITPTDLSYNVTGKYFQSQYNNYTGVVFYIPFGVGTLSKGQMTGSIQFNQDISANIIVVGGGAGGGSYFAPSGSSNKWVGCGGGGGATITVPLTLTANTKYNLAVGQGGVGGNTSDSISNQTRGNTSYFQNGTTYYNAGGGTLILTTTSSNPGFQNSSGGEASVSDGSTPSELTRGGGGGGGGGEPNNVTPSNQGTGGTGGSYNNNIRNAGVNGEAAFYSNNQYNGGAGGNSNFISVSTPFSSTTDYTVVGGGGAGGGAYASGFACGYAGVGYGGVTSLSTTSGYYGWLSNANNNSYSQYTIGSGNNSTIGPIGLAGGYGGGGGATYSGPKVTSPSANGYGGNGAVIIWWYDPNYVPT